MVDEADPDDLDEININKAKLDKSLDQLNIKHNSHIEIQGPLSSKESSEF